MQVNDDLNHYVLKKCWAGILVGTVWALEERGEEGEDPGVEEGMVGHDLVQEGQVQRAVVAVQREVVRLRDDALHPPAQERQAVLITRVFFL